MTAQQKLDRINQMLNEGWDCYICTAYRATRITPRNAAKWAAAGRALLCVIDGHLMLASGSKYLIADHTTIRFAR